MSLIQNLLPEGLVSALGWTLLHALWQGAFVALLLSLLLVVLQRQTARVRYVAACSAMLLQLLLSVGTCILYLGKAAGTAAPAGKMAVAAEAPLVSINSSFWANPLGTAQVYFEQHLPLLVTLWLLGLALMALRFIGGLAYTQRLRHYRTSELGAQWQQQLQTLQRRLGVQQAVRLAESALVQVPMAIGVAKPVILLPVGAVTGLTQAQVEAILAHELAHILRKDYLLNLLLSVVEMLYFYHPAMWWISGVVRAEREHCCDDVAVALCGDSLTYARALTELEAMRMPAAPAMAVAFSGQRGSLINRIKRLVGQPLRPSFTEGFAAGLVLVVGMLALSLGAVAERQPLNVKVLNQPESNTDREADAQLAEETAEAVSYTAQDGQGNSRDVVIITNKKGKVKELYVDGKRIPNKDIDKYKDLIDQRLQATRNAPRATAGEVEALMEQERVIVDKRRPRAREERVIIRQLNGDEPLPPLPAEPPLPPPPPAPAPPPPPPAPPAPPVGASKKEQKAYQQEMEEYKKEMERYAEQVRKDAGRYEREVRIYRMAPDSLRRKEIVIRNQQRTDEMRARQEARRHEMETRRAEMEVRRAEMAERRQQHAESMRQMKEELVKDGLIESDSSNLNLQLNNGEFFINGKKQPQKVYDKYKKWLHPAKE